MRIIQQKIQDAHTSVNLKTDFLNHLSDFQVLFIEIMPKISYYAKNTGDHIFILRSSKMEVLIS